MKWGYEKHYQDLKEWHFWFAWHPITFENGIRCWLEWCERKEIGFYDPTWIYQECSPRGSLVD